MVVIMNQKKINEMVKEALDSEKRLFQERKDLILKNEVMENQKSKVQGPISMVQHQIRDIESLIFATGEENPLDLKVAKERLEKLQSMNDVAQETINKNTKRVGEIDQELAENERNRKALTVFSNMRELNDIALTGMFKPLTKTQEDRLRELYKWNGRIMNAGAANQERYLHKRAIKDLLTGKPLIKLY